MKVIGFLNSGSERAFSPFIAAYRQGLAAGGAEIGSQLSIESRYAEGDYDRLPALASELVAMPVDVSATAGGAVAAKAAIKATAEIPILFVSGHIPAKVGLSAPNARGVNVATTASVRERVQRLRQLLPKQTKIAVFLRPGTDVYKFEQEEAKKAGLIVVKAAFPIDLAAMFETAVRKGAGGLLVCADPSFTQLRAEIIALAARYRLPAMYPWRSYVEDGGLASHGPSLENAYRRIGLYTAMILGGENPKKLQTLTERAFRTSIHLGTARNLNLSVHPSMLHALADDVVE